MIRFLAFLALFASPAFAQDPAAVRDMKNAANRADYACQRGQLEKCAAETHATIDHGERALATPEPPGDVLASSVHPIPSNFDSAPWLVNQGYVPPPQPVADPVGAFRIICQTSWIKQVDPLVQPGVKLSMHRHMGWGNDAVDENSTYETLRSTGSSKCQGGPLYRSAAWSPTLETPEGKVVLPDYISIYYKRYPKDHPACRTEARECADFPAGLRFIVGRNYAVNGPPSDKVRFVCIANGKVGALWTDIAPGCVGQASVQLAAPNCWDGARVSSADFQSHLAYQQRDRNSGKLYCPATHPVMIPTYTIAIAWTVKVEDRAELWNFSNDRMMGLPAGAGFHIDYWEAQDDGMRAALHANCIDKHLNCSGGQLGDGRKFVAPQGFSYKADPRIVEP